METSNNLSKKKERCVITKFNLLLTGTLATFTLAVRFLPVTVRTVSLGRLTVISANLRTCCLMAPVVWIFQIVFVQRKRHFGLNINICLESPSCEDPWTPFENHCYMNLNNNELGFSDIESCR